LPGTWFSSSRIPSETGAGLDMRGGGLPRVRLPDPHRGPPADALDELGRPRLDRPQPEERHQPVVEGDALSDPVDPQDQVSHPVYLDPTRFALHGRHGSSLPTQYW